MRRPACSTALTAASAAIIVATVTATAWAYTPLTPHQSTQVAAALVLGVACWIGALGLERRRPVLPARYCGAVAAVVALGSFMAWNARAVYESSTGRLVPVTRHVGWLPGALDGATTATAVRQLAAVLLAVVALTDLAATHARARALILWALAVSGAGLAAVGVWDRLDGGSTSIMGITIAPPSEGATAFATFSYHGNAGAYLNLTLPAALVLMAIGFGRRALGRTAAATGLATLIAAGCAANVSKAGQAITPLIIVGFALAVARSQHHRSRALRVGAVAAGTLAGVVILALGVFGAADRWDRLRQGTSSASARDMAREVAGHAIEAHPWFGGGAGTMKLAFPEVVAASVPNLYDDWVVQDYVPGARVSMYSRIHDDPLEILADWGIVGGVLLGVVLAVPLVALLAARPASGEFVLIRYGAFVALGGVVVHSLVDFPFQVEATRHGTGLWAALALATWASVPKGSEELDAVVHRGNEASAPPGQPPDPPAA